MAYFIIYYIIILLAFIGAILSFSKLSKKEKLFTFYLILVIIMEGIAYVKAWNDKNNTAIYNILGMIGLTVYIRYFSMSILKDKFKRFSFMLIVLAFIFFVYNLIISDIQVYFNGFFSIAHIIIILLSITRLYFFYLDEELYTPIYCKPDFWITSAALLYYSGTLILFSFWNQILEINKDLLGQLYLINKVLSIFYYILISLAFYIPYFLNKKQNHDGSN